MLTRLLLPLLSLLITLIPHAQTKTLSLEDAMLRARSSLAPANLAQLQFYGATADYVYLKKLDDQDTWMRGNYRLKADTPFLRLSGLNQLLRKCGQDTLKTMPPIRFTPEGWIFMHNGSRVRLDPARPALTVIMPRSLSDKEVAEESSAGFIAYLDKHNLFVTDGQASRQLTSDGSPDIVYASSVHRDEFGISKGTFWSPDGKSLAYYRMDQSMVSPYPIVDWSETPARAKEIRYPMAGGTSHHVTVGIYHTATGQTVWLQTGEPAEQYLTNIAWSPDGQSVYIALVNRAQNQCRLNRYNARTGAYEKTLFEETSETYVEPLVPMLFVRNNPGQFIWQSNRDGWNHLYLYDTSGRLIRQLTRGNWEVLEVKGFDAKTENLFFMSTAVSAVSRNLYRLNWKTGLLACLTPAPGVHNAQLCADGNWVLDAWSTPSNPRTIQLMNIAKPLSQPPRVLLQAENPLQSYAQANISLFTIPTKQGDSLWCRLYQPAGADPGKKFPVIVYWYGGPHAQMILNSWNGGAGDYWFQYMAQKGYVVFTVDTRGSDNRGRAFEQSIFRRLGEPQREDLLAGLEFLRKQSFVDSTRMGLFGWSFGGFLTTHFLLHHPGLFKAGVAGGPVMDWRLYEIMYGERYMDTPTENPAGYEASNLVKKAGRLKDKLLIIHGLQDPVVVQQHSVNFVKAAVDAGVQVDYMIYPGHEHNVGGRDRVHLFRKITEYFEQHLR